MSYSLYVLHYPLIGALELYLPKSSDLSWYAIGAYAITSAMVLVAARIFYLAFEANTNVLREYLKRRIGLAEV
jgi:peptidoglycan/LPS O-acetylase OafA/YrhL